MRKRAAEDLDKIPKWAKSRIEVLQANIETLKRQLAEAIGTSDAPSEIRVSDYAAELTGQRRCLPRHSRVAFSFPTDNDIEFRYVEAQYGSEPYVQAMVTRGPSGHLVVTSESSNVINISISRHRGVANR